MNRLILSFLILTASFTPYFSWAQGGSGARGDDIVKTDNNSWILREIYSLRGIGMVYTPEPALLKKLKEIRVLVDNYTGLPADNYWNHVYGDASEYHIIESGRLPCDIDQRPNEYSKEYSKEFSKIACTKDSITYISAKAFRKLDLLQKALLLLHERAHVFDISQYCHENWIDTWIQGIYVLSKLKEEQDCGQIRRLEKYEYRALKDLMKLSTNFPETGHFRYYEQFNFGNTSHPNYIISQMGGGLVTATEPGLIKRIILKDTYISVDSRVSYIEKCEARDDYSAKLINSQITNGSFVQCANVVNSAIHSSQVIFRVYNYGTLTNSYVSDRSRIEMRGYNVSLKNLKVHNRSTLFQDDGEVTVTIESLDISHRDVEWTRSCEEDFDSENSRHLNYVLLKSPDEINSPHFWGDKPSYRRLRRDIDQSRYTRSFFNR